MPKGVILVSTISVVDITDIYRLIIYLQLIPEINNYRLALLDSDDEMALLIDER